MMPRPRIPEGPASPGWAPPPLPEPSPGLEDWPDHLELLEVEELAELLGSKDGVAPPALLGAVCSRIEALSGVKAPAAMQQRRVASRMERLRRIGGHLAALPASSACEEPLSSGDNEKENPNSCS